MFSSKEIVETVRKRYPVGPLELSAQFTMSMTPAHHWLIGTILADFDNVTTALYRATEKA